MAGVRFVHPLRVLQWDQYTDDAPSSGADFIFIPERPPKEDPWEDEMCGIIQRVRLARAWPYLRQLTLIQSSTAKMESARP